jgi:hypothetical protein
MPGNALEELRKVDEAMAQRLQDLMFVFEDMLKIDDKGSSRCCARWIPRWSALKGADGALSRTCRRAPAR